MRELDLFKTLDQFQGSECFFEGPGCERGSGTKGHGCGRGSGMSLGM